METEITAQVLCSMEELILILNKAGFLLSESFVMQDYYFSSLPSGTNFKEVSYNELLSKSFIIRRIDEANHSQTHFLYKHKEFDNLGNVIGEHKTLTYLEDSENAISVLHLAGLKEWCKVLQENFVYTNGKIEIVVQKVKDLGLFIEIEEYAGLQGTSAEKFDKLVKIIKELNIPVTDNFSCKKVYMLLNK